MAPEPESSRHASARKVVRTLRESARSVETGWSRAGAARSLSRFAVPKCYSSFQNGEERFIMSRPGSRSHVAAAEVKLASLLRRVAGPTTALDALAERTSDGVFVVDAERNIVLFNRRAEALTGLSSAEVLGRHCLAGFKCPRCLESCRVFDEGRSGSASVEIFRRDETLLRVRKSALVLRDRAGRVLGALEVFRSAAARDAAEGDAPPGDACGDGEAWSGAAALMSSLGRGLATVDREHRLCRVSPTLAALVGRPVEELVGVSAATVLGDALFSAESGFWRALLAGERREGWRATITRGGASIAVSVSGAPVPLDTGCGGPRDGTHVLVVRPDAAPAGAGAEAGADDHFEGMVGRSPAMRRVFGLIDHLRDSDATVLITGESGTGKELVARAIHARSQRACHPFVAVNCGALPGNLLDSELFGHVRGSFTGAVRDRPGRFEVVGSGTLFLDEIGDLPLELQVKLLRVLQERLYERVGDARSQTFRGRVVAATHRDLARAVAEERFRDDLFYRLNVVHLRLPPLRDRREEIEPLVRSLLVSIGRKRSRALRLSPSALRPLLAYHWPGNIRQLENALEYATAVCDGQTIHVEDLPPEIAAAAPVAAVDPGAHAGADGDPPPPAPEERSAGLPPIAVFPTADDIVAAIRAARGRRGAAAAALGISRTTLWRRMRELGLA
jgi:PAS domain S-box-containing protein